MKQFSFSNNLRRIDILKAPIKLTEESISVFNDFFSSELVQAKDKTSNVSSNLDAWTYQAVNCGGTNDGSGIIEPA